MKKLLLVLSLFAVIAGQGQTTPAEPAYTRFPKSIPLQLLLADSTTRFTLADATPGKSLMLMLFSPDCEHCKSLMRDILTRYDGFKDVQVVLATPLGMDKIRNFITEFDLAKFPEIIIGRDDKYLLPVYYDIKFFPFVALYDQKKELITGYSGSVTVPEILARFSK